MFSFLSLIFLSCPFEVLYHTCWYADQKWSLHKGWAWSFQLVMNYSGFPCYEMRLHSVLSHLPRSQGQIVSNQNILPFVNQISSDIARVGWPGQLSQVLTWGGGVRRRRERELLLLQLCNWKLCCVYQSYSGCPAVVVYFCSSHILWKFLPFFLFLLHVLSLLLPLNTEKGE